jgi:hypothetical protein
VPTQLPAGWDAHRVLGEALLLSGAAPVAALPQTATPATLRALLGVLAIAIAAVTLIATRVRRA